MTDIIDKVVSFNQDVLNIEQRTPAPLAFEEHNITIKCLEEEIQEYVEAYHACMQDDNTVKKEFETPYVVDMVDALMDNIYFAIGGLYKLGLTADQIRRCMYVIHECNVAKKAGTNAKRDTGAADAVKPTDWVGPEEQLKVIISERTE